MALGRAHSVAVSGVDGQIVEIEADIGRGLPAVHLVGLPDTALHESRDRIRAAVTNSGEEWPDSKVILALSPATLPKVGSVYDLALSLSVLDAAKKLPRKLLRETVFLGGVGARRSFADGAWCVACGACGEACGVGDCGGSASGVG